MNQRIQEKLKDGVLWLVFILLYFYFKGKFG